VSIPDYDRRIGELAAEVRRPRMRPSLWDRLAWPLAIVGLVAFFVWLTVEG
jgi:hypothetical protein